jgi:hypothetical protein
MEDMSTDVLNNTLPEGTVERYCGLTLGAHESNMVANAGICINELYHEASFT